eukprot:TRINITY_DN13184_c0_g1_i1.p1 TRINITY_DN13184_c0_g1~~TRINITY_DN13184_c0_g1_i1.p1  ORF type:complete len:299 (+),score=55.49 TRINITY_DN13184_c0_g1_i1:54-950(+)
MQYPTRKAVSTRPRYSEGSQRTKDSEDVEQLTRMMDRTEIHSRPLVRRLEEAYDRASEPSFESSYDETMISHQQRERILQYYRELMNGSEQTQKQIEINREGFCDDVESQVESQSQTYFEDILSLASEDQTPTTPRTPTSYKVDRDSRTHMTPTSKVPSSAKDPAKTSVIKKTKDYRACGRIKSDPVSRYQYYQQAWSKSKANSQMETINQSSSLRATPESSSPTPRKRKDVSTPRQSYVVPSEKRRDDLRWAIRAQIVANAPASQTQPRRKMVPNSYVPPTEQRRDSLRWAIRAMCN